MANNILLPITFIFIILAGCAGIPIKFNDGTTHHLIIGFGLVTVKEVPEHPVVITKATAVGATIADRPGIKFGVGYSSSTVVTVGDRADDVRIEVSKFPGGPLKIDVPRVKLSNPKIPEGGKRNVGD